MKNTEQLISKAITLLNQGKNELARLICTKIVLAAPLHYQAQLLLGVIALNKQENTLAEEHLRIASDAATSKHNKAQALNNLSLSLSSQQRLTEALTAINDAIQLKPQPLFYCNRANIFEQLSRWPEMQQDLITAISLSPDITTEAYTSLAVAKRHLREFTTALELLEQNSDHTDQDWLNEWALLHGINQQLENVQQYIHSVQLSDDALIALGDYALEQSHPDIAHALYLMVQDLFAQKSLSDHPVLTHQLNALKGTSSLQAPREYVESLFDSCAEQFEERLVKQLHYRLPERMVEQLLPLLPRRSLNAIDLGCGTGLLGKALSPHANIASLTGIDLSEKMLKQASKSGCYQHLIHGDIVDKLTPSGEADLIMAADVLIYLGDLCALFSNSYQALSAGGLFTFSIERCEEAWKLTPSGRYQHSPDYIKRLSEEMGFIHHLSSECQLRLEKNKPVTGDIYILQKA
ncbi:methyltransferase domain-containing protein [Neptunomonas qingdaonensis]|uniref:Predicted methyltransferase, contains TPR repeat n=1 Tax=Neptunomonas qingdaonensis TaxID=1045558 RepID=A0A1I2NVU4_9GAMM|nr:methyltransferase domain-containing protein [Neptunomonas qingdaonensis]SFG08022.1 Predicted methyltransferase, contains TPR repeat [Neptunomonas qingdaonensis]